MSIEEEKAMKVFIVDDSEILRGRLKSMLSTYKDVEIVGEAQNQKEAIEKIWTLKPNVVILDVRLSEGSGIEVLKEIKKDYPAPIVIVLTNYPFSQYQKKCMEIGADFFFDKSQDFNEIPIVFEQLAKVLADR
jgi:DNA-binding NarL/FixJ family response regulator